MIHEAIAAAESVIRALLLWIVIGAAAATAVTFAVIAAGWAICRVLRGAWAAAASSRTLSRRCGAVEGSGVARDVREPHMAAEPPSRPSWARTDKEAA